MSKPGFRPITQRVMTPVLCLFFFSGLLYSQTCSAQDDGGFRPLGKHSSGSKELIDFIKHQLQEEVNELADSDNTYLVRSIGEERIRHIVGMVRAGAFIHDDSLETYVNTTLRELAEGNGLASGVRRVLILDSPVVNAYCFGRGIYIVSVSLLGRISNEHELAFTLAHELAHDELGHIGKAIEQEARESLAKKTKEQLRKVMTGTIELEDLEDYRRLVYGVSRHSRVKELQADSMAMTLLRRAGYDQREALSMLSALGASLEPKFDIGADLFWPLHADEYPLQGHWFDDRLSIYSKTFEDNFQATADSIESHPDIALRVERIRSHKDGLYEGYDHQPRTLAHAVSVRAEFQTVQSAFVNRAFDRALFYALQLLNRYPENNFLISRIGRILIALYESKNNNDNTFQFFVPRYTVYYSEELTLVNNMLHNMRASELGDLAFHFLNNGERFDPSDKDHYYLLWKISDLTYRNDVAVRLRKEFREKFAMNISSHELR